MLPRGVVPTADGAAVPPTSLEFFDPARMEIASREVARRVYKEAEDKSKLRLHQLLAEPPSSPVRAALYESLYEMAALQQLSRGCTLTCWDASADKLSTLDVPPSEVMYFDNVADMGKLHTAHSKHLLVPRSKSFTAIDAVLPGGRLAQVTISLKHDVKMIGKGNRSKEGLLPAYRALHPKAGTGDVIDLYWILPEAQFNELYRSKQLSFPLIIPDEALKEVAAGGAASNAAKQKKSKSAAQLEKTQKQLPSRQAEWAALKQRVRHHAVCLQFTSEGKLKPWKPPAATDAAGGAAAPAAASGAPAAGGDSAAVK